MSSLEIDREDRSASRSEDFENEFDCFLAARSNLRRYMATPDQFPHLCELVEEAKKYYVRLPRVQRNTLKYIPFSYFGRAWLIRMNLGVLPRPGEVYIDLCAADSRAAMVTVAVGFENDLLEAVQAIERGPDRSTEVQFNRDSITPRYYRAKFVEGVWLHDDADYDRFLNLASQGADAAIPSNSLPFAIKFQDDRNPGFPPIGYACWVHVGEKMPIDPKYGNTFPLLDVPLMKEVQVEKSSYRFGKTPVYCATLSSGDYFCAAEQNSVFLTLAAREAPAAMVARGLAFALRFRDERYPSLEPECHACLLHLGGQLAADWFNS